MKNGLAAVRTFIIPSHVLVDTITFLRRVGSEGCEGFVVWGGHLVDDDTFRFTTAIVPAQQASMTEHGLLVTVGGQALFEINKRLHEQSQILAAQVHSHPTEAYHSSTDDTFPIATLVGALSIVVPDFARNAPDDLDQWAWYRLSPRGKWHPPAADMQVEIE